MARVHDDKDKQTFKEATANMTGSETISYIWEYYRWHIIGTIVGFVFVFSMVHAVVTNRDVYLSISFISGFEHTVASQGGLTGDEPIETEVDFFASNVAYPIWVDFELISTLQDLLLCEQQQRNYEIHVQQLTLNFETMSVFVTHTATGMIDILATYIFDLPLMIEVGHFVNLVDLGWDIPEHMMYNDYTIYLRYFSIFDDYVLGVDEIVVGIPPTTQNIENIEAFFRLFID